MKGTIAVGPGDGIGPEIVAEGVKVLKTIEKKYGHEFKLNYIDIGGISIDKHGTPLTDEAIEVCRRADSFFFGSLGGPKWDYPGAKVYTNTAGLRIRKIFDVYANLRPAKIYPGMEGCSPLKPEKVKEYKRLHAAVWPGVLRMIRKCHIRNYSIYLRKLPDGKLYLSGEDGDVFVVKAGPQFELVARNRMGQPLMATPAIAIAPPTSERMLGTSAIHTNAMRIADTGDR